MTRGDGSGRSSRVSGSADDDVGGVDDYVHIEAVLVVVVVVSNPAPPSLRPSHRNGREHVKCEGPSTSTATRLGKSKSSSSSSARGVVFVGAARGGDHRQRQKRDQERGAKGSSIPDEALNHKHNPTAPPNPPSPPAASLAPDKAASPLYSPRVQDVAVAVAVAIAFL
ncbi:hypothetical protein VOLCADRAFT_87657 [Volvox carteri f. nagariensis]|uniref:Uncharacterized protein n=1 Tax=Volvox carteri f. nagariensis TaxID=3068 RepID=D8TLW8_VOLCA|nr:uncharacterized protein VOLCADRAFT_87657 [Volvox carteri f. nagariensis]EFJ51406.1 hypothetical protein VOLCADRAFT_87657 [Volvox carteri f. nagariensis]|eukprot:XP_002947358.1 hypothetical protein VOLCADRAFT_87657 [Volvox carteri f. nagariensis]